MSVCVCLCLCVSVCVCLCLCTLTVRVRIEGDYSVSVPATAHVESIDHRRFGYFFLLNAGGVSTQFSVHTQTELNGWLSAINQIRLTDANQEKSYIEVPCLCVSVCVRVCVCSCLCVFVCVCVCVCVRRTS